MKIGLLAVALAWNQALPPPPPPPEPITVAASGDFLIHTPVADRALALGGGARYDFAPLFAGVRRHVAGDDRPGTEARRHGRRHGNAGPRRRDPRHRRRAHRDRAPLER